MRWLALLVGTAAVAVVVVSASVAAPSSEIRHVAQLRALKANDPALAAAAARLRNAAGAAVGLVWKRKSPQINPNHFSDPPESSVTARDGLLRHKIFAPPEMQFDAVFKPPPATLAAGSTYRLTVTVSGKLTGRKDVYGGRAMAAIPLVGDRWDGHTGLTVGQDCGPNGCSAPASAKATFEIHVPAPSKPGDTFSFGLGALNCGSCYIRYEYVAEGQAAAKPKPKPKPGSGQTAAGTLRIDYTMPTRFGLPGKNGLMQYQQVADFDPDEWRVDFSVRRKDGKACRKGDVLRVTAPASVRSHVDGLCRFHVIYKREGAYVVGATLAPRDGRQLAGTRRLVVQDWLIVGLGDSNGSGEGAPEVPRQGMSPERWQNSQCHRSGNSYQAQTARAIERGDSRTSVTFVHLACSGASIEEGLLGPYAGVEPGRRLSQQVAEMRRLVGKREIDAVLLSIGVNDLGFTELVKHCIYQQDCASTPFPEADSPQTLQQVVTARLTSLPKLYERLAQALERAGVAPDRVFITQYFDSTKNAQGNFCNPLIWTPKGSFTRAEAQWAYRSVLAPLNAAVSAAAEAHGWHFVSGAERGFRTHGYCSSDSWIVKLTESYLAQSNKTGTLHSTARGNTFQAGLVVQALRPRLYPKGAVRSPAHR